MEVEIPTIRVVHQMIIHCGTSVRVTLEEGRVTEVLGILHTWLYRKVALWTLEMSNFKLKWKCRHDRTLDSEDSLKGHRDTRHHSTWFLCSYSSCGCRAGTLLVIWWVVPPVAATGSVASGLHTLINDPNLSSHGLRVTYY